MAPNQETVNDSAKLIMHRLIVRTLASDQYLSARARSAHAINSERFAERTFVREWSDLLDRPVAELKRRLTSRDADMRREA